MSIVYWSAVGAAVSANIACNVAFKKFASGHGGDSLAKVLVEPWLWLAGLAAIALVSCYVYALRGLALSIAYPAVTSLAMVGTSLAAAIVFGEIMDWRKQLGLGLILGGVALLASSA
jgi:multidrug transporter EmrE-like cation transporter